jgi:hypothetical protein
MAGVEEEGQMLEGGGRAESIKARLPGLLVAMSVVTTL